MPRGIYKRNPRTQSPRTYKDNFWSSERVKKNLKIEEVADMLGYKRGKVGMWFTGQTMPSDADVAEVCKLFEINFNEGQLAFQKAHQEWEAEHNPTMKYSGKTQTQTTVKSEALSPVSSINNIAGVILALYGKLPCEQFLTVYNAITSGEPGNCDIERILYSKVDFDTYKQIVAIMKS